MQRFKPIFVFVICVFIAILIALTELFDITYIHIHGNNSMTNEQVLNSLEKENSNIFLFNRFRAMTNLQSNLHVYTSTVTKDYINRQINVNIIERVQIAYIRFAYGSYLRIDRNGFVMSTTDTVEHNAPVITGLNLTSFFLGDYLSAVNSQTLYIISRFAEIFLAYDVDPFLVTVDPTDLNNIRLVYGQIVVNLGDSLNLAEKFRIFLSVTAIPDIYVHRYAGGQLNITNIYRNWTFNLLT